MKTAPASTAVLIVVVALTSAAVALLAADASRAGSQAAGARQFQQLVHGLGMGPKLTLSRCPCAFDPRLHPNCRAHPPVACGEYFCPHHAASVFYLAPIRAAEPLDWETATDAEGR